MLDGLVKEYVYFCKKVLNCLSRWLTHFATPQSMNANSYCSASPSTFSVVSVLDFGILTVCSVRKCLINI